MTRFLVFVFFICGACFASDHDSDIFTPLRFRLGVESAALFHAPYSVDNEFAASLSADLAFGSDSAIILEAFLGPKFENQTTGTSFHGWSVNYSGLNLMYSYDLDRFWTLSGGIGLGVLEEQIAFTNELGSGRFKVDHDRFDGVLAVLFHLDRRWSLYGKGNFSFSQTDPVHEAARRDLSQEGRPYFVSFGVRFTLNPKGIKPK